MNKFPPAIQALFLIIGLFWNATARSNQFIMQFSVTGFQNVSGSGVAVPTDPVTGTIIYEAAGIHDPIQSFDSISMTIDGHSYTAGDLGFYRFDTPNWDMIGGLTGDIGTLYNQTDDFVIRLVKPDADF